MSNYGTLINEDILFGIELEQESLHKKQRGCFCMSVILSEAEALDKLNIPDWRHLSKDKFLNFVSMLPDLDANIAQKALEQFPAFAETTRSVLSDYKVLAEKGLEANTSSTMSSHDARISIIHSLEQLLVRDDLSFQQKMEVASLMSQLADKMDQKDTENKTFIAGLLKFFGLLTAGCLVLCFTLLCGKSSDGVSGTKDV